MEIDECLRLECGCSVIYYTENGDMEIIYCPKHAAALDLFEVLEAIDIWVGSDEGVEILNNVQPPWTDKMVAALELARDIESPAGSNRK